jgi:serine protease Do
MRPLRSPVPAFLAALTLLGTAGGGGAENGNAPLAEFSSQIRTLTGGARPYMVRVVRHASLGELVDGSGPKRIIGSGVSLGSGKILTSSAVVGSADEVLVHTAADSSFRARVLGTDRRTNVAVLEIEYTSLPAVPTAESGLLFPGDLVVAVGFQPPLGPRSSFGTVVLAEEGPTLGYTEVEMIHVTAPSFPGISGGILLNREGDMVGMVFGRMGADPARIRTASVGFVSGYLESDHLYTTDFEAVTLALPVGVALDIAREIAERGRVQRGFLGLQLELTQLSDRRAESRTGVLVHRIVPGSPADAGGLMPGDIVLKYGHTKIENPEDLSYLVAATRPGSSVPIEILREGTRNVFLVLIVQAPEIDWSPEMDTFLSSVPKPRVAPAVR